MGFVEGALERAEWRPNEISLSNPGACNDFWKPKNFGHKARRFAHSKAKVGLRCGALEQELL